MAPLPVRIATAQTVTRHAAQNANGSLPGNRYAVASPVAAPSKSNLRSMHLPNLRLHYGDGMLGLSQAAPFDGIILAAAGLEVPHLAGQLAVGARLVAPVGAASQHLQLITRAGKAEWISETLESCHFAPLCPGMA